MAVQAHTSHPTLRTSLWRILGTSRFYSVPYLTSAALCSLLLTAPNPSLAHLFAALLVPGCFAVGIAAWNDLAHLAADIRANRGRITDRRWLILAGSGGSLAALALAILGGWPMLAGLIGSLVAGVGYALVKSVPLASNLMRGLTTLALLLGSAGMGGAIAAAWPFVVGVALLDSAGNIWGDVRDRSVDQRAGTRTIATVRPGLAPYLALGLHALATAFIATVTPLAWLALPAGALLLFVPEQRTHEHFLQMKYLLLVIIGLELARTPMVTTLVLLLGLGIIPATILYRRLHTSAPSAAR